MGFDHSADVASEATTSPVSTTSRTAQVLEGSWRYMRDVPPAIQTRNDDVTLYRAELLNRVQPRFGQRDEEGPTAPARRLLNDQFYRHLSIYRQRTNYSDGEVEWNCAFSVCHPGDAFDRRKGQMIALSRFTNGERFCFRVVRRGEVYSIYFRGRHLLEGTQYRLDLPTVEDVRNQIRSQVGRELTAEETAAIEEFTVTPSQQLDTSFTMAYMVSTLAWRQNGLVRLTQLRSSIAPMGMHLNVVDSDGQVLPWTTVD
jgi:hypothetical protein